MASARPDGPWLIGGPGRCGKTYLAETLWKHGAPVAGFPLEGLFTVYSQRWLPLPRSARESLVEEYVTRPRYTDAARKQTETPARYFKSSPADLRTALPDGPRRPAALIGWILDRFAAENGRRTWAAFDLHPEFRYPFFRRQIPGLKLTVMMRDPYEAIAAALYWRGEPGDGVARGIRFKHSLIMYCLAGRTAKALARRWPKDVEIFDFNALVRGDKSERARLSDCFGMSPQCVREAYRLTPHFSMNDKGEFLTANGRRAALLTGTELGEISELTEAGRSAGMPRRKGFLMTARLILALAGLSPRLARISADLVYYPRRTITRQINSVRRFASSLRRLAKPFRAANRQAG